MKVPTSKFTDIFRDRQESVQEPDTTTPQRKQGKRGNPDYAQVTAYIPKTLHEQTKIALIREGNREFSELVEELLVGWNRLQTNDR